MAKFSTKTLLRSFLRDRIISLPVAPVKNSLYLSYKNITMKTGNYFIRFLLIPQQLHRISTITRCRST